MTHANVHKRIFLKTCFASQNMNFQNNFSVQPYTERAEYQFPYAFKRKSNQKLSRRQHVPDCIINSQEHFYWSDISRNSIDRMHNPQKTLPPISSISNIASGEKLPPNLRTRVFKIQYLMSYPAEQEKVMQLPWIAAGWGKNIPLFIRTRTPLFFRLPRCRRLYCKTLPEATRQTPPKNDKLVLL